ncbi:MAG: DNA polymerase III subunit delta' [Candidatus Binatia bacterium]
MTLSSLVGHERVVRQLRAAVTSDRPAHAYLVTGPVGIGKRTLAGAFAASLLCEVPKDGDACGHCEQCTRVAAGTHPDLILVRREEGRRDIRTEQAREVTRWLTLRPLMARRRKVAVIEEAECLNEHGQNALLKTLEEPPGATVLVLAATDTSLLLPTVRSRCQRLRLDPLGADVVERILVARGALAATRVAAVARAGGSPGRAIALLDDPKAAARTRMLDRLTHLPAAVASDVSATAQALGRDDTEVALETTVAWYRDLLDLVVAGPDVPLRNIDAAEALRAASGRLALDPVLRALDAACDTIRAVERNANRVLALETMLLHLRRIERGAGR